jgi:hypothetical protein
MPDLLWRVGSFAQRFPVAAAEIGRAHAMHARATRALFDSVGTAPESTFVHSPSAGYCCAQEDGHTMQECANEPGTCCTMGMCCNCKPNADDVEVVFPEVDAKCDVSHALEAALRDILTDPDVEDTASAIEQAKELAESGGLAALYSPKAPAKKGPDGEPGPEVCPICGAKRCSACGCCCECCDSAAAVKDADGHEEHEE